MVIFYTINYLLYHRVWISLWKSWSAVDLLTWKMTISAFPGQWSLQQIIQLVCVSISLGLEQVIIASTGSEHSFEVFYPVEV